MIRRVEWRRVVAAAFLLAVASCTGRAASPGEVPSSIRLAGRYQTRLISIEIADEPAEHERGLSHRDRLLEDHGMLFIFPDERDRNFWMKDTRFPLDIVFLAADRRIVGIVRRARPESEEILSVEHPSRYVLEVEGGLMDRIGVVEGDVIPFW